MRKWMSLEERFWSKVLITADDDKCWLWTAAFHTRDYGWFRYKGKSTRANRVAWILPNYVIPDGMEICHSCDNTSCVNPKHLFLGTHEENMKDMMSKGRHRAFRGEAVGISKLKEPQVIEMRRKYAAGGITQRELGIKFEVSLDTVHAIINRKTWKHI